MASTLREDVCKDSKTNCAQYDKNVCSAFKDWAKNNCAKTCDICDVPPPPCPSGPQEWLLYEADKTCLHSVGNENPQQLATWSQARNICTRLGGDLVIIRDDKKSKFVSSQLTTGAAWIGVHKVGDTFLNVDGSPLDSYAPWSPGNPDNHDTNENCVILYGRGSMANEWNDYSCDVFKGYVCSKPAIDAGA